MSDIYMIHFALAGFSLLYLIMEWNNISIWLKISFIALTIINIMMYYAGKYIEETVNIP